MVRVYELSACNPPPSDAATQRCPVQATSEVRSRLSAPTGVLEAGSGPRRGWKHMLSRCTTWCSFSWYSASSYSLSGREDGPWREGEFRIGMRASGAEEVRPRHPPRSPSEPRVH